VTDLVDAWRRTIRGDHRSWVLFRHGTCVVFAAPAADADLAADAVALLREYGPVVAGGPAGDFGTITLDPGPGYVVSGHHHDVLTFVSPEEVDPHDDLTVGLYGRSKRDRDGRELDVVHVEDRRQHAAER
jgi:hypothetical protein